MKAIFFDIDGTIYHPEIGISQNTIDEIHRVQKLGHKCFIASGRPTGFISKEVKSIGFDGFVLANGAHIVTEGKTIDSLTLPYEETKKLIEYVESQGYEYILLTTDRCYLKKESPHMYEFYAWCNIDMDSLCNDYDLDEVLKKRKVSGKTMGERMVSAQTKFSANDALWSAHKLANTIRQEGATKISEATVKDSLVAFRQALRDLRAL